MSATGFYIVGSLIFIVGGIASGAPAWMVIGSGMFLLGGIVALMASLAEGTK